MGVTGYEAKMYADISNMQRHLKRIADALERIADKVDPPEPEEIPDPPEPRRSRA